MPVSDLLTYQQLVLYNRTVLDLLSSWTPLALSAVALGFAVNAWRSSARRQVLELRGRVEDLEFAVEQTAQRMTKRARTEGMEQARAAHEDRAKRRDRIESEAVAILEQQRVAGSQQGDLLDPVAARAALRAKLLNH